MPKGIRKKDGTKLGFQKGRMAWNKDKKHIAIIGEKNPNWKGGNNYPYRRIHAPRPKPEKCEVCGRNGRICLDHNHKTGEFRGWLCMSCNSALGMVNDDIKILKKLIKYLQK